jgi:hypothetical protein
MTNYYINNWFEALIKKPYAATLLFYIEHTISNNKTSVYIGNKHIICQPYQIITSLGKLSIKLNLSRRQIATALKYLKKIRQIDTIANKQFTTITYIGRLQSKDGN